MIYEIMKVFNGFGLLFGSLLTLHHLTAGGLRLLHLGVFLSAHRTGVTENRVGWTVLLPTWFPNQAKTVLRTDLVLGCERRTLTHVARTSSNLATSGFTSALRHKWDLETNFAYKSTAGLPALRLAVGLRSLGIRQTTTSVQ